MVRPRQDVHEEIADMSPEDRGHLIKRVRAFDWPQARKDTVVTFIMCLGLIGEQFPRTGKRKSPQ